MIRLEQERLDRHLTREELSKRAGVAVKTIYNLEAKGQTARVKTLRALSLALDGVPASQLLLEVIPADPRMSAAVPRHQDIAA